MDNELNFYEDDKLYAQLAREIALDHLELPDILKRYNVSPEKWSKISGDKYFTSMLSSEVSQWNQTSNTIERSKLKAASLIEEFLPEAYTRLHDNKENLAAKVSLATLITKIAGMGLDKAQINDGSSEKFVVNIQLGPDKNVTLERNITPTPRLAIEMEE